VTVATEPLRQALLDQTREEIDRRLASADDRVEVMLRDAEERGVALVEAARSDGAAAAALAGSHEESQARRRATTVVLAARRELYEELRRQALAAARALRDDPRYNALLDRLEEVARAQLGEDTEVEIDPPEGGVRASHRARHVDYTLDALVLRCLDQLGGRLEWLWE
jgi:vacuolar-type H+-ATPase subunit E/Vma4